MKRHPVHPGEYVNVAYQHVRIATVDEHGLQIELPGVDELVLLRHHTDDGEPVDGFAIERVAPPEWPPQPGDTWRDAKTQCLWFAIAKEDRVILLPHNYYPDDLLQERGPMRLEHRPASTSGGA